MNYKKVTEHHMKKTYLSYKSQDLNVNKKKKKEAEEKQALLRKEENQKREREYHNNKGTSYHTIF